MKQQQISISNGFMVNEKIIGEALYKMHEATGSLHMPLMGITAPWSYSRYFFIKIPI
ncbi:MAG: hypothetical protein AAGB24_01775 [Bacteroidota bacterium]